MIIAQSLLQEFPVLYPSVWNDNEDFGNSFRTTNNIYLAKVFQLRKTM